MRLEGENAWTDESEPMSVSGTLETGQELDHFRIDAPVAESGMASIFKATDLRDGKQVALKVPHFAMEADPALFDRFQREEAIGLALDHPNVMRIYPVEDRSRVYMAMEWLEGKLLRTVMYEVGKMPPERAIKITLGILKALDYIHKNGVVHRDLKPENIMVDGDDRIKLIDFGIAMKEDARRLTFVNLSTTLGTPDYISPEQVKGQRGDQRSDIYALGVMLYEMLTGETPFSGPNPLAVMNERVLHDPRPARKLRAEISPQLEEILNRAMERDPRHRYATASEMAWDLEHPDHVGVEEDERRLSLGGLRLPGARKMLLCAGLALVPIILFALMLLLAGR